MAKMQIIPAMIKNNNAAKSRLLPSQNQRGPICSCISYAVWWALASYLPKSSTDILPLCFHNPSETKVLKVKNMKKLRIWNKSMQGKYIKSQNQIKYEISMITYIRKNLQLMPLNFIGI